MEIRMKEPFLTIYNDAKMAILEEEHGPRMLMIGLNEISFTLLGWELTKAIASAPTIYEFTSGSFKILGASIEKALIFDLENGRYKSYVVIKDKEGLTHNIILHITDVLALAVRAQCPIFTEDIVFNEREKILKKYKIDEMEKNFGKSKSDKTIKH